MINGQILTETFLYDNFKYMTFILTSIVVAVCPIIYILYF